MKKIPTIFVRDWNGDRSRVLDQVNPGCEWVFAGEGIPTRKIDGTCCLIRDGKLYKRREVKGDQDTPADFELVGVDEETQKRVGWVPVGDGSEDRWHREAFSESDVWEDGTYELMGPKIQKNPDGLSEHFLIRHGSGIAGKVLGEIDLTFSGIRQKLETMTGEGIVWHHPDGRMAKIKARDFGIKR